MAVQLVITHPKINTHLHIHIKNKTSPYKIYHHQNIKPIILPITFIHLYLTLSSWEMESLALAYTRYISPLLVNASQSAEGSVSRQCTGTNFSTPCHRYTTECCFSRRPTQFKYSLYQIFIRPTNNPSQQFPFAIERYAPRKH